MGRWRYWRTATRSPLGARSSGALLASLLLHANEVVSRDRLIDELWGASPPDTAPTALQVYVSQLRKALGRDLILRGMAWASCLLGRLA